MFPEIHSQLTYPKTSIFLAKVKYLFPSGPAIKCVIVCRCNSPLSIVVIGGLFRIGNNGHQINEFSKSCSFISGRLKMGFDVGCPIGQ